VWAAVWGGEAAGGQTAASGGRARTGAPITGSHGRVVTSLAGGGFVAHAAADVGRAARWEPVVALAQSVPPPEPLTQGSPF